MRNLPSRSASNSIQYSIGILLITASLAEIAHAAPIETSLQRSIGQALASRSWDVDTAGPVGRQPVEAIKTDDASGWVFGTATQILREDESGDPVTKLFIARNVNGRWISGVEGSSQFEHCSMRRPTLLAADERKNLASRRASLAPRSAALPQPGLALPWEPNAGWYWTGGAHGWSDKAGRITPRFLGRQRPRAGGARRLSLQELRARRQRHREGGSRQWLCDDLLPHGPADVAEQRYAGPPGDYLGSVGNGLPCGGQTTGPHVHFSLSKDGNDVSVNGMTIGGWQFFEGTSPYSGYAVLNQRRVSPQAWLINYGSADSGDPSTPVSARVQAPGPANLRSAPSLSAPVVGSLENGRTVQLACHQYGDSVNGNWGATALVSTRIESMDLRRIRLHGQQRPCGAGMRELARAHHDRKHDAPRVEIFRTEIDPSLWSHRTLPNRKR